ncbi:MAG: hypothetical protein ACI3XA_00015 [Clostridia bacterium]
MAKKTKIDEIRPFINDAFEKGLSFDFTPNGVSMYPFIKGGCDTVTIEEYKGGGKKYDIVFYQRSDGKYVMHRIVKILPDCFGVCGDNQWWIEKVRDNQIFAIVTSVRGKKKMGGFVYLHTLPLRRFIIHLKQYIKKHFRGERK